jgi:hypothetical protein
MHTRNLSLGQERCGLITSRLLREQFTCKCLRAPTRTPHTLPSVASPPVGLESVGGWLARACTNLAGLEVNFLLVVGRRLALDDAEGVEDHRPAKQQRSAWAGTRDGVGFCSSLVRACS